MKPAAPASRVLVIAKGFPPDLGGIETYSREVALAYSRAGNRVHVLTSHTAKPTPDTAEFDWFKSVIQRSQPETAVRMLAALTGLRLRGYAPEMIHATSWRVAGFARLIWPKVPLAITVHGREVFAISHTLARLAGRVLARANLLVFVSDAIRRKFRGAYPAVTTETLVAWNGCTEFAPDPHAPAREADAIFTVCRLVERKNVRSAVQAVATLRDRGIDCRYRIAGSGPESSSIARQIAELGLGDRVEMLGFATDAQLAAEYARASVFLHPQIEADDGADIEGFGIAIADAMQFGAVPVAGANGGPLDFIRDGDNGYLVDALDVAAIAACLENLLSDGRAREAIGERARRFATEQFSWAAHVDKIRSVLGGRLSLR
jgi:glycosyltransferase involved in cell wall biosynthesis